MAGSSTDVRDWLIEQGHLEPGRRGPLSAAHRAIYDAEHGGPGAGDAEVSGADPLGLASAAPSGTAPGERPPARSKGTPLMSAARTRLWGPGGRPKAGGRGRAKGKHARVSLAGWAEDLVADLAWLAGGMPPIQKILMLETPYVGVVFEDAVKGTVVDNALQPVARNMQALKAVNGVLGPAVYVAGITLFGQRVEVPVMGPEGPLRHPETGEQVTRVDFDGRTKAMFMGLRYSLMQMGNISPAQLEAVQGRTADRQARAAQVDAIIDWIFSLAPPAVSAEDDAAQHLGDLLGASGDTPAPPAATGVGWPQEPGAYPYPPAPPMDAAGADPGRMSLPWPRMSWWYPTPPAWRGGPRRWPRSCSSRWRGGARGSPAMRPAWPSGARRRWRRRSKRFWRAAASAAGAARGGAQTAAR